MRIGLGKLARVRGDQRKSAQPLHPLVHTCVYKRPQSAGMKPSSVIAAMEGREPLFEIFSKNFTVFTVVLKRKAFWLGMGASRAHVYLTLNLLNCGWGCYRRLRGGLNSVCVYMMGVWLTLGGGDRDKSSTGGAPSSRHASRAPTILSQKVAALRVHSSHRWDE